MNPEWHDVALGAISIIMLLAGIVWAMIVQRLNALTTSVHALRKELTDHVASDSREFQALHDQMYKYHIQTLDRIAGRWTDKPHSGLADG